MQHSAQAAVCFAFLGIPQAKKAAPFKLVAKIIACAAIMMAIAGPGSPESAAAAISIVDNAITPISSANNPTTFSIPSFTVSSARMF